MLRRELIGGLGAAALMAGLTPQRARAQERQARDVLVCVFLRGGADALNLVVPWDDEHYHAVRNENGHRSGIHRPTVEGGAIQVPESDYFGFHPAFRPLIDSAWTDRRLACVMAAGDPEGSRSHFANQDRVESASGATSHADGGWLGRYLQLQSAAVSNPLLRAVALQQLMPKSLRRGPRVLTTPGIEGFRLNADEGNSFLGTLEAIYDDRQNPLEAEGHDVLQLLHALHGLNLDGIQPNGGVSYPASAFGRAMEGTARLIKGLPDVELICVDRGGWDTHSDARRRLDVLVDDLARGLDALYRDLKAHEQALPGLTVLVMSEFGRRVAGNLSQGSDHGFGGLMMLLGDAVNGGFYARDWLAEDGSRLSDLEGMTRGDGDLKVSTDYRDVLGQIMRRRMGFDGNGLALFPGHGLGDPGWDLVAPR